MNTPGSEALNRVLHQPVRTRIVAYLATCGKVTFTDLKKALSITDGNLEAHMKKLVSVQYIDVEKDTEGTRPQTLYALSPTGIKAFHEYVDVLQNLLNIEESK